MPKIYGRYCVHLGLLCSLFAAPFAQAQKDTVRIERVKNYFPHIANFQTGEIPYALLCDSAGIQIREEGRILSFRLAYQGERSLETLHIEGNRIPDSVCAVIALYGLGQMIFLTDIEAEIGPDRERVHLVPMHLSPVRHEE